MHPEGKAVPPKISARPSAAKIAGAVSAMIAVGVCALVFFFNPSTHSFYPTCVFHSLTGWHCPTCGMTRALHALLHGNVMLALRNNVLFIGLLALMTLWGARFAVRKIRHQPANLKVSPKFWWPLLILALLFAVARNLPGGEWLAP